MKRVLVALTFALTASAAQAQGQCACVTSGGGGALSAVRGAVSVLSNSGLTPVLGGAPITVGSRVITGPDGSANLSIGRACSLSLGPNSEADVAVLNRSVCVRVAQTSPAPGAPEVTALDPAALASGVVVLGGIGAAIGIGVTSNRGDGVLIPRLPVPQISP